MPKFIEVHSSKDGKLYYINIEAISYVTEQSDHITAIIGLLSIQPGYSISYGDEIHTIETYKNIKDMINNA